MFLIMDFKNWKFISNIISLYIFPWWKDKFLIAHFLTEIYILEV